jgi:hypothetical protein
MPDISPDHVAALERRNRILIRFNAGIAGLMVVGIAVSSFNAKVSAQDKQDKKVLTVSELAVVDEQGRVRVRIGGELPDAVIDGKAHPRGQRSAGILLYDETGTERSGYITFEPSGNVGLTLDNRSGQTAQFIAGPDSGSAIHLQWRDDAVELRVDEDGPSLHAVRAKNVAFHEPAVKNAASTELCKALRQAKPQASTIQLLEACRARSSEAACQVCLGK